MPPKKNRKNTSYLLCTLDDTYSLFASKNSFVIKERVKSKEDDAWVGKYFYSDLNDALRGYTRHLLRSKKIAKKVHGDIKLLQDELVKHTNNMAKFCKQFEHDLMTKLRDPVEHRLLQNAMEISTDE